MRSIIKRILDMVIIAATVAVVTLLFFVNPTDSVYMPKCPWRLITHTNCPSCGNTRAAYHILHGEYVRGFMFNPFFLVSIAFLVFAIWVYRFDNKTTLKIRGSGVVYRIAMVYVALFMLWWVIRNLIGM